jgi:2-polyprenyl-6-methoxyphenol hydroxylase-like FAD-dependent oxidoreductase
MRVGIVGLGTAGTSAAVWLARAGHEVAIFERAPRPGAVGAGIMLQPTGMAVLERLGLADQVVSRGAHVTRLRCVRGDGRRVIELDYEELGAGLYGAGMHRGVLFEVLANAAAEAGALLQTGCEITRLDRRHGRRVLVDAQGQAHGPFDLVIVGDGARSALAAQALPHLTRRRYAWGALFWVGEDPGRRFRGELFQIVDGARHMLGLLPTGLGPHGDVPLVSIYWSVRLDLWPAERARGLDAWKAQVRRLAPQADEALDRIRGIDELITATYHDVVAWPWDDGDVVVLGDAAHAMSPQLGQGANLALWDAMVLADALAVGDELPRALDRYSRARRGHVEWFQLVTRWLTPLFQSDARALGWLRDLMMPLVGHVPWVRRQMIAGMTGTARGPLTPLLPLPARLPAPPSRA